ncbi:HalOD1 output domain-containing protein [Haloplanus sp. C73]|uniref:HalOD1 output domain-containing protein n=1 Tax=Haloplanus sp. C73 TaxID=3421641 RepID=UPI003EB92446
MRNSSTDSDCRSPDDSQGVTVVNHYETSDVELSVTVVHAVLEATGKDPMDVNLNDVIQPDALNRIFAPKPDGTLRDGGTISFDFAGCHVTVQGDGEVRVDPNP